MAYERRKVFSRSIRDGILQQVETARLWAVDIKGEARLDRELDAFDSPVFTIRDSSGVAIGEVTLRIGRKILTTIS